MIYDLLEDALRPRKERRKASKIYLQLVDETGIRNELAIIKEKSKPSPIYEPFSPLEIRSYDPSPELYNCLLVGGGDYGFTD